MYIFFEKVARGGISYIFNKYSKTNNKYYPKQEPKHVVYLDANIYMAMQYLNFFQQLDLNGYILKSLTQLSILAIIQKDVFLKLILNIQKNYENYTMIIL